MLRQFIELSFASFDGLAGHLFEALLLPSPHRPYGELRCAPTEVAAETLAETLQKIRPWDEVRTRLDRAG